MGEMQMAGHENSNRNLRTRAGVVLLSLGSLVMLGKLGLLAVQLPCLVASLGIDTFGVHVALGLTLLRLIQTIAFDHAAIFSFVTALLVLFFALVAIVVGLALMRKRSSETA
jgi:hypothetical protein